MRASACQECRVGIEIIAEMAGQEAGLQLWQQTDGCFLVEKRMGDLILFALLPSGEDFFSGIVLHKNGSVFFVVEVLAGNLLAVDQRERGAVGKEGPEFFHEIESQRRAAGTVAVEKTALGIETAGFQGTSAFVCEQCIEEGKESIDRVERWAA